GVLLAATPLPAYGGRERKAVLGSARRNVVPPSPPVRPCGHAGMATRPGALRRGRGDRPAIGAGAFDAGGGGCRCRRGGGAGRRERGGSGGGGAEGMGCVGHLGGLWRGGESICRSAAGALRRRRPGSRRSRRPR